MIYAIKALGTEFVKFGKSQDPIKRLAGLQTSNPYELKLVACADWADSEEPMIHLFLGDLHQRGEWFRNDRLTEKVIGLLRDGDNGLREWQRISRAGNERPIDLRLAVKAMYG